MGLDPDGTSRFWSSIHGEPVQAVMRLLNLLTGSFLSTIGGFGDRLKGMKRLGSGQLADPVHSAPHVQKTATFPVFFFFLLPEGFRLMPNKGSRA